MLFRMTAIHLIKRLHEHRIWANCRLIEACQTVTAADLAQTFDIGQGSIWKSLTHLVAAEFVWLEALEGNESPLMPGDDPDYLPGNQRGERPFTELVQLAEFWSTLDRRWQAYLSSLDADDLGQPVSKVSTSSGHGKSHATRRSDVLMHVCTHAQYTSAQLVNMLKQVGVTDLPDVMLITMAREETAG